MKGGTAQLNKYRQSPRKVRLVIDAIRGKSISDARKILTFITKRATGPIHKLLDSAVQNAKVSGADEKTLFVKAISVNGGDILYRRMPAPHGSAHPIRKRTSKIQLELDSREVKEKVKKNSNKEAKKQVINK